MGCSSSAEGAESLEKPVPKLSTEQGVELLENFLRVDRAITREEKVPPIPLLGHQMVRLERVKTQMEAAISDMAKEKQPASYLPGSIHDLNASSAMLRLTKLESWDDSIRKVMHELNINKKPELALEHEEFLANLTRKAMKQYRVVWLNRMKQDAQEEVNRLSEKVQHLQRLYEHQDDILNGVVGERKINEELEKLKRYRDTVWGGELGWLEAAALTGSASRLSGTAPWSDVQSSVNADTRFVKATETRHSLHEAALSLEMAQALLPGVQFPYCSSREINALLQILEYIYTDMQIPERYKHCMNVYSSFNKRATALHQWIKKMMKETIHKDVEDVENTIATLSTQLCNERVNAIRQAAGLGTLKGGQNADTLAGRLLRDDDRHLLASSLDRYKNPINNNSMFPLYR